MKEVQIQMDTWKHSETTHSTSPTCNEEKASSISVDLQVKMHGTEVKIEHNTICNFWIGYAQVLTVKETNQFRIIVGNTNVLQFLPPFLMFLY